MENFGQDTTGIVLMGFLSRKRRTHIEKLTAGKTRRTQNNIIRFPFLSSKAFENSPGIFVSLH